MVEKEDYFKIHSKEIEDFLDGVRNDDQICTNHKTAKKLERKYHITLKLIKTINYKRDIRLFRIVCN